MRHVYILIFTSFWLVCSVYVHAQPSLCTSSGLEPSEKCATACLGCGGAPYQGSTLGWAAHPEPPGFCSDIQNDQWFAFVASAPNGSIAVTSSNCAIGNGIQAAVYDGCAALGPLSCHPGAQGGAGEEVALSLFNLTVGKIYYLVIDGFSQDACDFSVECFPANFMQAPPVGNIPNIQAPLQVCKGASITASVPSQATNASYNVWQSTTPGVLFNGQPSPASIASDAAGVVIFVPDTIDESSITICAQPNNGCNTGASTCFEVELVEATTTNLPPITICASQLPYTLPWGEIVVTSGTYSRTLQGILGCDSTVVIDVAVATPVAEILGSNVIGCGEVAIVLNSVAAGGTNVWVSGAGNILGTGNSLSVDSASTVILTNTVLSTNGVCTATDTITVTEQPNIITMQAQGGLVGCGNDSIALSATAAGTGVLGYMWSGPAGFVSTQQSPTVSLPGTYTVTASNTLGCTGTATVEVLGSSGIPVINVPNYTLTCAITEIIPTASSLMVGITYLWPGSVPPMITIAGTYTVTATDAVGCTSTTSFVVSENTVAPTVEVTETNLCNGIVEISTTEGPHYSYAWTLGPVGPVQYSTPSFVTDIAEIYTVVVTDTINGCTSSGQSGFDAASFPYAIFAIANLVQPTNGQSNGGIYPSIGGGVQPYTSYQWTLNGTLFANTRDITDLGAGNYSLTITDAAGCTSALDVVLTEVSSSNEASTLSQHWQLRPNPSSGLFQVVPVAGVPVSGALRAGVWNALGQLVWERPLAQVNGAVPIDLSTQPNGHYMVLLEDGQGGRSMIVAVKR
jgi:hypothetical protein